MYVRDLGGVLRRRWQLVVAALLLTGCLGVAMAQVVTADYRTSASVVLVPPETTLGETGNPYLFLGGLDQSVDVVARTLNSGATRTLIADASPSGATYTAVADFTTSAPIILVTTEAKSPEEATELLAVVVEQVSNNLLVLQSDIGVVPPSRIGSQVVARNDPEALQKPRLRRIAVASIGVLMVLLVLVVAADSLLARRRRAKA